MEFFIIFAFYYWRLTGFLQVGKAVSFIWHFECKTYVFIEILIYNHIINYE